MSQKHSLFYFMFAPLLMNGRWVIWFLAGLIFVMLFGNAITATRMEIPSKENLKKISGIFLDTSKGYTKGNLYPIAITDSQGNTHKCSCEPLAYPNCLGRQKSDHSEIKQFLDTEVLEKYGTYKAMIKWLNGKPGEVWMYPNRSLLGGQFSCYQIADSSHIYRSYERSIEEYLQAKNGIDVYLFWLVMSFGLIAAITYFSICTYLHFKKRRRNKQPEC